MTHATDEEISAAWTTRLRAGHPEHGEAVGELHALLLRGALAECHRRSGVHGLGGVELDDLAHQAADDAVVSVLRRVEEFRGESRFTTWAYRFVLLEVSSKLGRHAWRHGGVAFDDAAWERLPERCGLGPEAYAEGRELVAALKEAVEIQLTGHQRRVFVALVVDGIPLDALTADLGCQRNAVYKTMFDARRKLRAFLAERGLVGPT